MKNQNRDKDMPIGKVTVIKDFLPPPSELIPADEHVRITIFLKKASVNFFKREATRHHTKYQKMMREVLDRYASNYK